MYGLAVNLSMSLSGHPLIIDKITFSDSLSRKVLKNIKTSNFYVGLARSSKDHRCLAIC